MKPDESQVAVIREAECIGCTKCIQVCPYDAIIGASKQMHTVFASICTGCALCVAPCPVDCIDLVPIAPRSTAFSAQSQQRQQRRQARLDYQKQHHAEATPRQTLIARQSAIQAAVARTKLKRKIKSI